MNDGFEMPKEVPTRVPGFDPPRQPSPYAPPQTRGTRAETKVLEGLERELSKPAYPEIPIPPGAKPVPVRDWSKDDGLIEEIRNAIKKLTHRQMQQLCNQIYKDDKAIDRIAMPEVLDHFAHGD